MVQTRRTASRGSMRGPSRSGDKALAEAAGLHRAGQLEQAEKAYRRILRRRPTDARALYYLGIAVHQRRRPKEAIRHFRASLKGDPNNPEVHRYLGLALKDTGQPAAAEGAYREPGARRGGIDHRPARDGGAPPRRRAARGGLGSGRTARVSSMKSAHKQQRLLTTKETTK